MTTTNSDNISENTSTNTSINTVVKSSDNATANTSDPPKKKRGRKPKNYVPPEGEEEKTVVKVHKKRGRKPKGGKIISTSLIKANEPMKEQNVILHLRCNSNDIRKKNNILTDIKSYNESNLKNTFLVINDSNKPEKDYIISNTNEHCVFDNNNSNNNDSNHDVLASNEDVLSETQKTNCNQSDVHKKLKDLSIQLHTNNITNKKSSCFWCTYDFNNPPVYIPMYKLKDSYHCYGCFCSPECATAYLFKESINTSIRFKRYHLLNYVYGKIFNYTESFKPAPNPYYTLDKYFGNLDIDEYRKLSTTKNLLFIADKPLTRTLPELHEDNEDFILNHNIIPSSTKYTMRRKMNQSKSQILTENFNLTM